MAKTSWGGQSFCVLCIYIYMELCALSKRHKFIGVFDSGAGGLSVLCECRRLLPGENFLYYADIKNAPYGGRGEAEIQSLTLAAVKKMAAYGLKALLIACNTATSAAADAARKAFSFPVAGMEPALKPAAKAADGKSIVLLCTPATATQEKLKKLMSGISGAKIITVPQPDWADAVESNIKDLSVIREKITRDFAPCLGGGTGAVVLGCTHYILIKKMLEEIAFDVLKREIPFFDGCLGTANNLKNILIERDLCNHNKHSGQLLIVTASQSMSDYWAILNNC